MFLSLLVYGRLPEPHRLPDNRFGVSVPSECREFLARCLTEDYRKRPSAASVLREGWLMNPGQGKLSNICLRHYILDQKVKSTLIKCSQFVRHSRRQSVSMTKLLIADCELKSNIELHETKGSIDTEDLRKTVGADSFLWHSFLNRNKL